MTFRRTAVLAQATALLLLLVPGLYPGGSAVSRGAVDPRVDAARAEVVLDAAGKGVGCSVGRRRFKGPRVPGDPPPVPGSKPTPSPQPEDPSLGAGATDEPAAEAATMLLAATTARTAQADPTAGPADPVLDPDGEDAEVQVPAQPGREPSTRQRTRRQARAAGLIAGLDVSHHNGIIDWEQVKKTGREFVFMKATQDTSFVDPLFPTNYGRAKAAGLAVGAYHFFDYTLDGKAQADHFLDRVERAGAIDGALPPVVDVECWAPIGSSTHVAAAARLRDFIERVYERTARLPIIYTSVHMWREVVGNSEGFSRSPLWAACWGCGLPPSIAPGWGDWAFWQTGVDQVPGIGRLDGNFFNGSQRDLNRLKLKPLRLDNGRPATGDTRVNISLGGRDATQVRSSLDGENWTPWRAAGGRPIADLDPTEGEQTVFVQLRAGPGLRSEVFSDAITLDLTGPSVSEPAVTLREGPIGPRAVPVAVSWVASDAAAGLSDAAVEVGCGSRAVRSTEAPGSAKPAEASAWLGDAAISSTDACTVTAVGRDGVGNETRVQAPAVRATIIDEQPSDVIRYEGEWQDRVDVTALDGSSRSSDSDQASVSAMVSGRHVGIVAALGPDGGRAEVFLDDAMVGLIDTYAATALGPNIVFTARLEPGRTHRLSVRPLGTSDVAATARQVAIDGFAVLS